MNTKTMRLPPRRVSMPTSKRKERDGFDLKRLTPPLTKLHNPTVSLPGSDKASQPVQSNQLLAGYLAHEFLTRGTLFGETWDPTRPRQTVAESKREIGEILDLNERSRDEETEPKAKPEPREEKRQRYVEVTSLLKTELAEDRWGPHTGHRQPEPTRSFLTDVRVVFSHVETPHWPPSSFSPSWST